MLIFYFTTALVNQQVSHSVNAFFYPAILDPNNGTTYQDKNNIAFLISWKKKSNEYT